jgi:arginase
VRSVDPGERRLVHEQGIEVFDMRHVDEVGMRRTMEEALDGLDSDTHLHVSFDVDFLDPEIAPGVGTTVPGGPTYREAQLCMEMIADTGRLASLDIVELNPAFDVRNRTAALAVDLVESLFGKSTLMRQPVARHSARPLPGSRPPVLEGIARGERAIEEGRTVSHAEAKRRLGRWLK